MNFKTPAISALALGDICCAKWLDQAKTRAKKKVSNGNGGDIVTFMGI